MYCRLGSYGSASAKKLPCKPEDAQKAKYGGETECRNGKIGWKLTSQLVRSKVTSKQQGRLLQSYRRWDKSTES